MIIFHNNKTQFITYPWDRRVKEKVLWLHKAILQIPLSCLKLFIEFSSSHSIRFIINALLLKVC